MDIYVKNIYINNFISNLMTIIVFFLFLFIFCIKTQIIKHKIFYIFTLLLLPSCVKTIEVKKEYIEYTPAIYETKNKVKERQKTHIKKEEEKIQKKAKQNHYEILESVKVISVLENNAFLVKDYDNGLIRITNFYNPLVVDGDYLCKMFVKREGNFSYHDTLGAHRTVKNFKFTGCIQNKKFTNTEPQLIKKAEYKKQEVMVKYRNKNCWLCSEDGLITFFLSGLVSFGIMPSIAIVHDLWLASSPEYTIPYSDIDRKNDNLPNSIDDLLCEYYGKKEKCKSLKDVCKQHKDVCKNIKEDGECYRYYQNSYSCELEYKIK